MKQPLVSVVLPFYNPGSYLEKAAASVLTGDMREIELVLVDDGSTDDSAACAKALVRKDPRVKLFRRKHAGIAAALNAGIRHAAAPLIARMDADDISAPERFTLQYRELMNKPRVSLTSCLVRPLSLSPISDGMKKYLTWVNHTTGSRNIANGLLIESPLPHPSVMFRKEDFIRIGGYRDYDGPEDYDLWLRMKEAGMKFSKVKKILLDWRIHEKSLSRTCRRYRKQTFIDRKFEHAANEILKGRIGNNRKLIIWGAGRVGGSLGGFLLKRGIPLTGFIDIDPARIGSTRHGLPVQPPEAVRLNPGHCFYIGMVGTWTARENIRGILKENGKKETRDFVII